MAARKPPRDALALINTAASRVSQSRWVSTSAARSHEHGARGRGQERHVVSGAAYRVDRAPQEQDVAQRSALAIRILMRSGHRLFGVRYSTMRRDSSCPFGLAASAWLRRALHDMTAARSVAGGETFDDITTSLASIELGGSASLRAPDPLRRFLASPALLAGPALARWPGAQALHLRARHVAQQVGHPHHDDVRSRRRRTAGAIS